MEMSKPNPISKPIPIPEPISIPEPIMIPKPIQELIPELIPIPESIQELIPETNSEPAIRNRFQETSVLAGIDSEENFIFPITSSDLIGIVTGITASNASRRGKTVRGKTVCVCVLKRMDGGQWA